MDIFKIDGHQIIFKASCKITSPLTPSTQLYYCVSQNGDIFKLQSLNNSSHKSSTTVFKILGCPSAIEIYQSNKGFIIADLAHQSIFIRDNSTEKMNNLITQFNQRTFHGPSSIAIPQQQCTKYNNKAHIYFTDSGAFGETSIQNRLGSVYCYKFEDKTIRSLINRQLAYPCCVILSPDQKCLMVCQLGQNRIIRVVLDADYSANYSVFHQFSGRMGPSSICYFNQFYFVSLFEFAQLDNTGLIAVLNQQGQLIQKINLPTGPEISSIKFLPTSQTTNQMICLIAEENRLHQIKFRGQKIDLQSQSDGINQTLTINQKK